MTIQQLNAAAVKIAKKYPLRFTFHIEVTGVSNYDPETKAFTTEFAITFTNTKVNVTVFNSVESTEVAVLKSFEYGLKVWALDFKVCPHCGEPFKPLMDSRIYCSISCRTAAARSRNLETVLS